MEKNLDNRYSPHAYEVLIYVERSYPHLIGWIRETLGAHAKEAKTVASLGFPRLSRYFSEELLRSTKCRCRLYPLWT
jgi:hypothetical protein